MLTQTKNHVIEALEKKQFFKLVCGASLTDIKMIEDLSFIFTLAGAHVIDLAPTADVIFAAKKGIERALHIQDSGLPPKARLAEGGRTPMLMASIQLDKDPHFRKVEVDYNLCDLCGACIKICPTSAFKIEDKKFVYFIERCFGCGICPSYCHASALNMKDTKLTPKETLNDMLLLGIKAIEFHFGKNYKVIEEIWPEIKDLVKEIEILSFSIGSELLNNDEIRNAANLCYKLALKDIILQCDGKPMSGGLNDVENGNNSDIPSFQVAKVIQEEKLPVYLQISGGTNQLSYTRALEAHLDINGVAIGSYARKLLMPFLLKKENVDDAVKIAQCLVDSVKIYERK